MPRFTHYLAVTLLAAVPLACSPGTLDVDGNGGDDSGPSPSGDVESDDDGYTPTDDTGDEPASDTGDTRMSTSDTSMQTDADAGEMEDPEPPSGNELPQEPLFVCNDQTGYTESRIRRIDRQEWRRNTANAAGSIASTNPFDPGPTHQYSTYDEGETINESILDIYMNTVEMSAYGWETRDRYASYGYKTRNGGRTGAITANEKVEKIACMYDEGRPDSSCVETFVEHLLERGVLYRPATDAEVDSLADFAEGALDDEESNATSRRHTIERIVSAAWMTSGALFRTELGDGQTDDENRQRLGDWELAQAIAYALDGRAPGTPGVYAKFGVGWTTEDTAGHLPKIRQAAIDGTISQDAKIKELVETYIAGEDSERTDLKLDIRSEDRIANRGQYWMANGIEGFFREWLGYPDLTNIFKDTPGATTPFAGEVSGDYGNMISGYYGDEPLLVEQMDDMIARIIANDQKVFETLLTTREYYTPATAPYEGTNINKSTVQMNRIYNITESTEATREDRWKSLPKDERAGVLTHPAFLAAHGGNFENDPSIVHRGKWVREKLLCDDIPPVPITVNAALDPETRDQSARKRMTSQVDSRQKCAGCHDLMNPLGYPFETYNHAGYLRTEDHGMEPNGSSTLKRMPDPSLEVEVDSAVEMSEKFAESQYVKRCFIRQTFRYFMGREERKRDACTLSQMETAYDDSGGSFAAMLTALFQSDSFQYRVDSRDGK